MTISRLTLTDFRNHAQLDIAAAPGFVLLTRPNGALELSERLERRELKCVDLEDGD